MQNTNKKINFALCLCTVVFFLTISTAFAAPVIGIADMYDVLKPDEKTRTKRIYNTGDSTAFVRVEHFEIIPATKKQPEVSLQSNPQDVLNKKSLIVTPLRMIIPPGGFQSSRILWLGDRDKERYFRIRYKPVMPTKENGFDGNDIAKAQKENFSAGLNIMTGYGTIVVVPPENPRYDTQIQNKMNIEVGVKNNGNATIILDKIRICPANKNTCSSPTKQLVLPNTEFTLKKEKGERVTLELVEGNSSKKMTL